MSAVSFRKSDPVAAPSAPPSPAADTVVSEQATPTAPPIDTAPAAVIPGSAPEQATPTADQEAHTKSVGFVQPKPDLFADDGNIGFEDMILPRLNIVQKVGDLSNVFTPGEVVFDKKLVLHSPASPKGPGDAPVRLIILGFQPLRFAEKIEGGEQGRLCKTEADVVAANGTLDYGEWAASKNTANPLSRFERLATAVIMIECPATCKDPAVFPFEIAGKTYCLALWSLKGTAYTHATKPLAYQRRFGALRKGYRTGFITLTTELKKFGDFSAHVPVVKIADTVSPEALTAIESLLRGE